MNQVTSKQALEFVIRQKRGQVLRNVDSLIRDFEEFRQKLERSIAEDTLESPSCPVNSHEVIRMLGDYQALLATEEALKIVGSG